MNKLAVIFPGIGYHTDKPLLYYGKKLAQSHGYEILEVPYKNFERGIKGDPKKMQKAYESALKQTEVILEEVQWERAEEILFISKSIGTVVASSYARRRALDARQLFFTPLKETFDAAPLGDGIAFHGTNDPWAADAEIEEGCRRTGIDLVEIAGANHSLETGDVKTDLENLQKVMEAAEMWLAH